MSATVAFALISVTVLANVYAQLVLKWRVLAAGALPADSPSRLAFFVEILLDPWTLSAYLAIFLGSICWIAALLRLPLTHAYPFLSASYALVVALGAYTFGESVGFLRAAGVALIMAGIILTSYA